MTTLADLIYKYALENADKPSYHGDETEYEIPSDIPFNGFYVSGVCTITTCDYEAGTNDTPPSFNYRYRFFISKIEQLDNNENPVLLPIAECNRVERELNKQ